MHDEQDRVAILSMMASALVDVCNSHLTEAALRYKALWYILRNETAVPTLEFTSMGEGYVEAPPSLQAFSRAAVGLCTCYAHKSHPSLLVRYFNEIAACLRDFGEFAENEE